MANFTRDELPVQPQLILDFAFIQAYVQLLKRSDIPSLK